MKKKYINPTLDVIKLQTQKMLAASGDVPMKSGNATEWGARSCDDFDDCED